MIWALKIISLTAVSISNIDWMWWVIIIITLSVCFSTKLIEILRKRKIINLYKYEHRIILSSYHDMIVMATGDVSW